MRRRLAVILASDVAGYSRLVALDEESAIARFTKLKAVLAEFVASHHGRIFNTAGDAVLAEFQSATDAVRCAIEFQETARTRNSAYPNSQRMDFRIGIAIGDVLVQEDGDLLGDGVNIAARLESIAEPGGVVISGDVHNHVERNLSATVVDMGPQTLKNIARPVQAFALRHTTPAPAALAQAGDKASVLPLTVEPRPIARARKGGGGALLSGIALLAIIALAGWWYIGQTPAPTAPRPPQRVQQPPTQSPTAPVPPAQSVPPMQTAQASEEFGPKLPEGWTPPAPEAERRAAMEAEIRKFNLPVAAGQPGDIASDYAAVENYKALAIAPTVGYWSVRRAVTEQDASTIALEACHLTYGKPCVLVARGETLLPETAETRRLPQVMPRIIHTGPFELSKVPILGPAARARPDVAGYSAAPEPKAMAIHPLGRVTVATAPTVEEAEAKALGQCDGLGSVSVEGPCRTYALDNTVVLPQRRSLAR